MLPNIFSVDVEDYFHVQAFADQIRPSEWEHYESRVLQNTLRIVDLLEKRQTRATFFVLGWVADRFPGLVRQIYRAGHEIGCHSYWHQLAFRQTPEAFREDLRRATETLANITGQAVVAYRAPSFSITSDSLWALDILLDEGYQIDSSVFPVRHDTYGIPEADPAPHVIHRPAGDIFEFPPAVRSKWFGNIPVAGGGYFRILPYRLTDHWLANVNRKENRPFVFYIHPWEVDPEQPRLKSPWKSRLRHYRNLHTTQAKLDRLLQSFRFAAFDDLQCTFNDSERRSRPLVRVDGTHRLDSTLLQLSERDGRPKQTPPRPHHVQLTK
jgi:polysaccharide deacetylase family protein (PEP-CTERM system associated)